MSRLPFIDEHTGQIAAPPDRTWRALLATFERFPQPPRWLTAAWGLQPPTRARDWSGGARVGDSLPGFTVAEADEPNVLALEGGHRFSRYELRFVLEPANGGTRLRAETRAVFPGLAGRLYRGLVIGTGGHRIAVRRILAQVAHRAETGA